MDFFELTTKPISIESVARRVIPPQCGATVTLDGYVRKFTQGHETLYLVYEAYEEMALKEMQKLIDQAHEKFEIANVGMVHRLGKLDIGETSVVISVAAPHRKAAFQACEWLIRELKRTVPIWKKEVYSGGEEWIEGHSEVSQAPVSRS
jgi:molybdopterin synthase catalytic subunit